MAKLRSDSPMLNPLTQGEKLRHYVNQSKEVRGATPIAKRTKIFASNNNNDYLKQNQFNNDARFDNVLQ